jgi:hypothetical protein
MRLLFLAGMLCFALAGAAQKTNIQWSDQFGVSGNVYENNVPLYSIPAGDGAVLTLFKRIKPAYTKDEYSIARISSKPDIEKYKELDFEVKDKTGLIKMVKLRNTFYLIKFRVLSKESTEVFVQKLNPVTLETEPAEKRIAEVETREAATAVYTFSFRRKYSFNAMTNYSPDSTKFALLYGGPQKAKGNSEVNIMMIDDRLEKVYSKVYAWQEKAGKVEVTGVDVDNDGRVIIFSKIHDDFFWMVPGFSQEGKNSKYTCQLEIIDAKGAVTLPLAVADKIIYQTGIVYGGPGKLALVGLLKDSRKGRVTGVYRATVNLTGASPVIENEKHSAFPQPVLAKIDTDKLGKSDGKDPGLDLEFDLRYVISRSDGYIHMVTEYTYVSEAGASATALKIEKADMLVTTFDVLGNSHTQCIPRDHYFTSYPEVLAEKDNSSFMPVIYNEQLMVFSYDHEDNLTRDASDKPKRSYVDKNAVLTAAVINHEKQSMNRMPVFPQRDMDGFEINMQFTELKPNTWLVYAVKEKGRGYSMKAGLLTIK